MALEYLALFVMACWLCTIFFEHIFRSVLRLNEAVAFLGIEPLHGSDSHFLIFCRSPDEFAHSLQAGEIIKASIIKLDRHLLKRQALDPVILTILVLG